MIDLPKPTEEMRTRSLEERPRLRRQDSVDDTTWQMEERLRLSRPRLKRMLEISGRQHHSEDLSSVRLVSVQSLNRRNILSQPCSPTQRSVAITIDDYDSSLVSLPLSVPATPTHRPRLRLHLTKKLEEKSPQESHWVELCLIVTILILVVSLLCAFFSVSGVLTQTTRDLQQHLSPSPSTIISAKFIVPASQHVNTTEAKFSQQKNESRRSGGDRKFRRKKNLPFTWNWNCFEAWICNVFVIK